MIVVDTLADMKRVLPACACAQMVELTAEFADGEDPEAASFTALFGGAVVIVQAVDEMERIQVTAPDGSAQPLARMSLDSFDVAEWLCSGHLAKLVQVTNSLGGTQYFVPRQVVQQCRTFPLLLK